MNRARRIAAVLLFCLPGLSVGQTEIILDNVAPAFSVLGTWPASTAVPGYVGTNYQTHEANGPSPLAVTVDNSDAGFSVTGTWTPSTSVSGYYGANYQHHYANGEPPTAIVADNTSGSATGTWPTSTSVAGYYGANYQVHTAGTGANAFTWSLAVASAGTYEVYARWTAHPNRATNAKYTVNHAGGASLVQVNQEQSSGAWVLLGTYSFNAGAATVSLSDEANEYVIADAVMLVPPGAAPNTATWTVGVPSSGTWNVYARWTAHPNRATDAKYTVNHAGGSAVVTVNQEQATSTWNLLGTYSFNAGNATVTLTDQANGYVIADAVMFAPPGAPPNSATWTPNVASAGTYQVYAQWTANANRATDAKYIVTHAQGSTQVTVNQQANGSTWNLLGAFQLAPGATHNVTLTDQANGYVIADAIRLVLANVSPTVSITAPTAGAVVNAPGPVTLTADANDPDGTVSKVDFYQGATLIGTATSSPFTIQWSGVAAGNYSLTAVATDNNNATTTSAAVSIRVNALPTVSLISPSNDATFTTPATVNLAATAADTDGTIAKVEFFSGATLIATVTTAPYEYAWAGVAAGSYSLTAVATDNDGATSTAGPNTITVSTPQAKLYFIHPDHLNTPRQVYDDQQQLRWKWDQTEPFGVNTPDENPLNLGTFEQPTRFPGQYADKETGLAQNGRRDYASATGTYVQGDPIGLEGGLNLYGYVGHNPIARDDPTGEIWQAPALFCARFPRICAGMAACFRNPSSCKNRFCAAGNRLYHPLCDFPQCLEGEGCATTSFKLGLAEGCYANRLAVGWFCGYKSDPRHERERAIAWEKAQQCLALLPINCKDCVQANK